MMRRFSFSIGLISLLILACRLFASEERETFDAYLKDATRSYGLDRRFSEQWLNWKGLETADGMALLVNDLLIVRKPGDGAALARSELCWFMLDHAKFSKSSLADYIKDGAAAVSGDSYQLARHLLLLDSTGCAEVPWVVPYWAGYLSDTRNTERYPRHPESQIGQPVRVCDVANGCLRRYLEKHKLWMPGDPGYGDAGGETMWDARDRGIDALNGVLLSNKLITMAVRPPARAASPPQPNPSVNPDTVPPGAKTAVVTRAKAEPVTASYWWLWAGGALAVGSLAWLFYRRGK